MLLRVDQPRYEQPQGGAQIDWSSDLSRDLRFCIVAHPAGTDAVSSRAPLLSLLGTGAEFSARYGGLIVQKSDGTTQYQEHPVDLLAFGTGAYSISFLAELNPLSNSQAAVIGNNRSGTAGGVLLYRSGLKLVVNLSANFVTTLTTAADLFDSAWHFVTVTRDSAGNSAWFVDGTADNTASASPHNVSSGFAPMIAAQRTTTGQQRWAQGSYALFLGHNRAISLQEHVELSRNPWQLFEPRRIWVPQAAAAGLPTLSASTYKPGTLTSTGWTPRITAT
jgi:hypothetical protein